MTQGMSLLEALFALLLFSCSVAFALTGVLKCLQRSQQATLQLQLSMAITDLQQSQLQAGLAAQPSPAALMHARTALSQLLPHYTFHFCSDDHRLSWYSPTPLAQYAAVNPCVVGDNQVQELTDAPRI